MKAEEAMEQVRYRHLIMTTLVPTPSLLEWALTEQTLGDHGAWAERSRINFVHVLSNIIY